MEGKKFNDNGELVPENPDDDPYGDEDRYQNYNDQIGLNGYNEYRDGEFSWDVLVKELNFKIFGNQSFLEGQKEVINACLSGRDVMALIPTGGGKSLTFQLPALVNTGYTFVIMPLISLIEDQVYHLKQRNIRCYQFSKFNSKEH